MSLSDSMYGPHVLVCVRVRGAFQKKKNLFVSSRRRFCAIGDPLDPTVEVTSGRQRLGSK